MSMQTVEIWINQIEEALEAEFKNEQPIGGATRAKNAGAGAAFEALASLPNWRLAFNNSGSVIAVVQFPRIDIPDRVHYTSITVGQTKFAMSVTPEFAELRFDSASDAADVLLFDSTPFSRPLFLESDFSQLVEELHIQHLRDKSMALHAERAWILAELNWHNRKKQNLALAGVTVSNELQA